MVCGGGQRVLIVEDERATCALMRTIFALSGFDVLTAHTVAEGIALLDSSPDYLILDMTLPDGDGREVLGRVREAGLPTRVAVATGWAEMHGIDDLYPDIVLCKPINFDDLLHGLGIAAPQGGQV